MDRKQLDLFRKAYDISVKKCIKGKDKNGKDIEEQGAWVWFDRKTIEEILKLTDANTGGIKIYFGQYDKENLDILPKDRETREDYIGRMSLALVACDKTSSGYVDVDTSTGGLRNGGDLCPPDCNP